MKTKPKAKSRTITDAQINHKLAAVEGPATPGDPAATADRLSSAADLLAALVELMLADMHDLDEEVDEARPTEVPALVRRANIRARGRLETLQDALGWVHVEADDLANDLRWSLVWAAVSNLPSFDELVRGARKQGTAAGIERPKLTQLPDINVYESNRDTYVATRDDETGELRFVAAADFVAATAADEPTDPTTPTGGAK